MLPSLVNDLAALPEHVVLVLDDYHLIYRKLRVKTRAQAVNRARELGVL